MKAIVINDFGDRSRLTYAEVEKPQINEGEVLIRIKAAGVNPVDTKIREGYLKGRMPNILPITLGWDLAGIVVETGYSARRFCPGDEVFAYARRTIIQHGTYAEYITLPESYISHKPSGISFEAAAAVPLTGLTAFQAIFDKGKLEENQNILILGASGGVGSFAVQFAKVRGAIVYAVAGPGREDYLKSLGADHYIDYSKGNFRDQLLKILPEKADLAFDCVGHETTRVAYECVREHGILVSILNQPDEKLSSQYKIKAKYLFVEPNARQLDVIRNWIEEDKVRVPVQQIFDLKDAALAHEAIESTHTQGKIVLRIS